jgi:hypothetical protein
MLINAIVRPAQQSGVVLVKSHVLDSWAVPCGLVPISRMMAYGSERTQIAPVVWLSFCLLPACRTHQSCKYRYWLDKAPPLSSSSRTCGCTQGNAAEWLLSRHSYGKLGGTPLGRPPPKIHNCLTH